MSLEDRRIDSCPRTKTGRRLSGEPKRYHRISPSFSALRPLLFFRSKCLLKRKRLQNHSYALALKRRRNWAIEGDGVAACRSSDLVIHLGQYGDGAIVGSKPAEFSADVWPKTETDSQKLSAMQTLRNPQFPGSVMKNRSAMTSFPLPTCQIRKSSM